MRRAWILSVSLLIVLVLLIGMGAGACGNGAVTPPDGEEEEEAPPDGEEEEEEELVTPPPAEFEVISLDVEPSEVTAGETVTITAMVVNIGGRAGNYAAILTVDGITEETQEMLITHSSYRVMTFYLVKDTPGTYEIGVGEFSSILTVKEKTTPPTPGEWTITRWTGSQEVKWLTFTVSPDSTSLPTNTWDLWGFKVTYKAGTYPYGGTPITDGQFILDFKTPWDIKGVPRLDIVLQGEFDETGTHASGTWEASAEGTPYAEGTWEASAP